MTIKLDNGFVCEVAPEVLADYEVLEDLVDMEQGHPEYTVKVARRLLSPDDLQRLKDICRNESGRVDMMAMFSSIKGIIDQLGSKDAQTKKS